MEESMISKNRLFMILLLINNMALINAINTSKNFFDKGVFNPEPTITLGSAVSTIFYYAGNYVTGPIIESTLSLIGSGLGYLASGITGEENKDRRSHIYAATSAGLLAWSLVRKYNNQTIIPKWNNLVNWWNGTPNNTQDANKNPNNPNTKNKVQPNINIVTRN